MRKEGGGGGDEGVGAKEGGRIGRRTWKERREKSGKWRKKREENRREGGRKKKSKIEMQQRVARLETAWYKTRVSHAKARFLPHAIP